MKVATFRDLMAGRKQAEITCLYSGKVVRKLIVMGDHVEINAMAPPLVWVPLDTPIRYEPWVFDRGSLLFDGDATGEARFLGATLKICGEGDIIIYQDKKAVPVEPAGSGRTQ